MKEKFWIALGWVALLSGAKGFAVDSSSRFSYQESSHWREEPFSSSFKGEENGWLAGTLFAPGGHTKSFGVRSIGPMVQVKKLKGVRDGSGKFLSFAHEEWGGVTTLSFASGLTSSIDLSLGLEGVYKGISGGPHAFSLGDLSLAMSFQLVEGGSSSPSLRLICAESFPTGKYERLDPMKRGVDGVGVGGYQTTFTLAIEEKLSWGELSGAAHLAGKWGFSTAPSLQGFSVYGGGAHTEGEIDLGRSWGLTAALEMSMTRQWALGVDFMWEGQGKSSFRGQEGVGEAPVGGPAWRSFTVAPAIEYSLTKDCTLVGGVWWTLSGKNCFDVVGGALSFSYAW